ncbi:MAG: HAMP domain-containing sensor histidine kinase [Anaerovoracaceae bacterium]
MSIKFRVTLWYTALMTILVVGILIFLFFVGEKVVLTGSEGELINTVKNSSDDIDYDEGQVEIDEDLNFFADGAYISIYDNSGKLLYGQVPPKFKDNAGFINGKIQNVGSGENKWQVYDMKYGESHYGNVWIRGIISSDMTSNAFDTMLKLAFISFPFLIILCALGGYFITNRAFAPVRQITQSAENIGTGKDLNGRINLGEGKDEIYILANTFDGMFDRLQASFDKEKQFTSDASHELRTPTSVIISQCEYALENSTSLDETKEALNTVLNQAQKMSALIGQLLTLARADQGKTKLQIEAFNFSELVDMVADQLEESANAKNISIEKDIKPDLLIRGDQTMLMRMLLNLMENGIKYGKTGGNLTVFLDQNEKGIIGFVRDDGIGIGKEQLPKIWERFYQVDTARASISGGIGLGLSLVKYIVEAHNGQVSVESVLDKGTTFTFFLPTK